MDVFRKNNFKVSPFVSDNLDRLISTHSEKLLEPIELLIETMIDSPEATIHEDPRIHCFCTECSGSETNVIQLVTLCASPLTF